MRGYVKTLMERTFYPDNEWTRSRDGSPRRPYDMATYTMAEFMGVRTVEVKEEICGEFEKLEKIEYPKGDVPRTSKHGYVLDCRYNDSHTAAVKLLENKVIVSRFDETICINGEKLQPGAFLIHKKRGLTKILKEIAESHHLTFLALNEESDARSHELKSPRIAMYQRYGGGNMDEGWTRWTLEKFEIPYTSIMHKEIEEDKLKEKYDVILFPSDRKDSITGEEREEAARQSGRPIRRYPPEYEGFIGEEGIENLKKFVEEGGKIVALNTTCDFVIEKFEFN